MNFVDAIKTNRPFRRASWTYAPDAYLAPDSSFLLCGTNSTPRAFSREDLLADDWEVQEPKVTITLSQLRDAAARVRSRYGYVQHYSAVQRDPIEQLARVLGFPPE